MFRAGICLPRFGRHEIHPRDGAPDDGARAASGRANARIDPMTLTPDNLDGVGAETAAAGSVGSVPGEHRRLLIRGLTWSAAFQVFDVIVSFAAMLVLVRIIPPGDYGRVAAVLGVLGFVNLFNANQFYQHALQLPEHDEPDWHLHWTCGFYIQVAQSLLCHALAEKEAQNGKRGRDRAIEGNG